MVQILENKDWSTQVNEKDLEVVREPYLAEKIVFVDGIAGCGKTMMTPIIGGLSSVELQQASYQVEWVCSLRFLRKIDGDATVTLIRMFTDLQLYNVMMSRETNFRYTDLSAVWSNPRALRYVVRLFQKGDEAAVERIRKERPILHLFTHFLLGVSLPIFTALVDRVRIVEVVRHPLYILKQLVKNIPRYGIDARSFNIWFNHNGRSLPWYAKGWEDKYIQSNAMDRAIYMIDETQRLIEKVLSQLSEKQKRQIIIIPFERFVTDPWPFMERLENFLGTKVTSTTRRVMKKQNVPRKMYAEGIDLKIYRKYGWEPPQKGSDEAEELERRREFAAGHASPKAMEVLGRLCDEYEAEYLHTKGRTS